MNLFENIRLALTSLKANKMRSLLTMLGIIIGIGSVIAIVTVGDAMTGSLNEQLSGMGGKNITLGIQSRDSEDDDMGMMFGSYYDEPESMRDSDLITDEMLNEYRNVFKDEIAASSVYDMANEVVVTNGYRKAKASIFGVSDGFGTIEQLELVQGRFIREEDVEENRPVAMVTENFAKKYLGSNKIERILDQPITVGVGSRVIDLYVIGIFREPSSGTYSYMDSDRLLMPISLERELNGKSAGYSSITVMPKDTIDASVFSQQTEAFFKSYYLQNERVVPKVNTNEQFLKMMNDSMNQLKLGIGSIAAISLLVGGIGVMNIMMVSVTERTREIGIRMALGAKSSAILLQFVTEAIVICLIGGMLGVAVGTGLGSIASTLMTFKAKPSLTAIFVAVGFSMAIGVFFGYYPAKKAASMDPVEALRYE